MLFVEFRFIVFFGVLWAIYWSLRNNTWRKMVLLGGSYLFYAAWDWRFLSLILLSTVVDYLAALRIPGAANEGRKRGWLVASLITNLGVLGFFKYFNFFAASLVDLFNSLGVALNHTTLEIVLPVGISFYTFQTLSYTIDVYRGKLQPRKNPLDVALFVAFFPQLVAGPIVRASHFLPQLDQSRRWSKVAVRSCLTLFLIGFIKKAGVSDNIAPFVDQVFADPGLYSASAIWGGILLYGVQIYCDFSGYSDMAIATAGLLGYRLPVNFNAPYLASSLTDFWRRWHMSLSTWLRDYLYIPLGGNRGGRLQAMRNVMITMLLGGLWHGAAWNFVIWGGLHGVALVGHRAWISFRGEVGAGDGVGGFIRHSLGMVFTFWWVFLAWIFFRAQDLSTALEMLRVYLTFSAQGVENLGINPFGVLTLLGVAHWLASRWDLPALSERIPFRLYSVLLGAAFGVALSFVPLGYRPFIYFQF
ncbi:MAG: MBOAT family protein [Magnetococcales bacterium]|nr:MBOAT family protein [Magnetococcales bacterium]